MELTEQLTFVQHSYRALQICRFTEIPPTSESGEVRKSVSVCRTLIYYVESNSAPTPVIYTGFMFIRCTGMWAGTEPCGLNTQPGQRGQVEVWFCWYGMGCFRGNSEDEASVQ